MPPKKISPYIPPRSTPSTSAPPAQRKKKPPTPFAVKPIGAFYVFLAANILAALYAPIQDCDETFNYWEPTHFMSHGYGLETWEYSPDYAIRSWLYIGLHAIFGNFRRILPHPSKVGEFYFIRYVLGFVCALCQTMMFRVVNNILNPRIALFFMMAMVLSPGMFHAAAAFLPSSFAMYTTMLGTAAFMNWRGGLKTAQAMTWFAVGGVVGWPFSVALCAPFLFEELVFAYLNTKDAQIETIMRLLRGTVAGLLIVLFEFLTTGFMYKKVVVVPWNIVMYNIFSGPGRGPEIYGTEAWDFYFRNLLLNFNIWFLLALAAAPLFFVQKLFARNAGQQVSTVTGLRSIIFMSPFYLWLLVFTLQPHKEERFMYPMYPSLALNAAMALHIILSQFGTADPKTLIGRIPPRLKLLIVSLFILGSVDIGLARIYGIYTAYSAPLKIYEPLASVGGYGNSVCFGKEWYRFPSSYHLPHDMHAKFIKSEFSGLLPGEFSEAKIGFWTGAWLTPPGMNDQNIEDMGKYVDLRACDFLVDTYYPGNNASTLEPNYVLDDIHWDKVKCLPFLDSGKTHMLARTLWLPSLPFLSEEHSRKTTRHWGEHCLLKKKKVI